MYSIRAFRLLCCVHNVYRAVKLQVYCIQQDLFSAVRPTPAQPPAYGPPSWSIPLVGCDVSTRGEWLGRYGSRGHRLFGLLGNDNITEPYIVGVSVSHGRESNRNTGTIVGIQASDPKYAAALQVPCQQPDPKKCTSRSIGCLATSIIEPMAIEVGLRPALMEKLLPSSVQHGHCLNISLYFVDWTGVDDPITGYGDRVKRINAVDVFTVAPGLEIDIGYATAVLKHPELSQGEYRTWRVCTSQLRSNATGFAAVRFRVYVATGFNATVSAIFLD